MKSLYQYQTWEPIKLCKGLGPIGNKWGCPKKQGSLKQATLCYKVRPITKRFTQKESIFSPVVKNIFICIQTALVLKNELELI